MLVLGYDGDKRSQQLLRRNRAREMRVVFTERGRVHRAALKYLNFAWKTCPVWNGITQVSKACSYFCLVRMSENDWELRADLNQLWSDIR